ncbi:NAD(P)/FAD-dependent oxidoreductase [Lacipirellula sp.]|uniref:NAD(P)/FAD-dependent oxidoreductase n=1 Tax=Lacipirellula sp. TaxID=2691419 RepID=UPI003D0F7142
MPGKLLGMDESFEVVVIGAGAAGLMAATRAAERGRRTLLLEKNTKPGVKILMSGGTRCNLTHSTDARGIVAGFGAGGPFLHSALAALGPDELVWMFEAEGVATKVEETGKVFPASDRALDVLLALRRMLDRSGAELRLATPVLEIAREGDGYRLFTDDGGIHAERLIITVGGQSYPGCGTIGEGYAWAKTFGHKIIPPRPALVPLTSNERWVQELSGVTVPDVMVQVAPGDEKPCMSRRASFLFTHFGLSGPAPMDVSRAITERPQAGLWKAICDFVPTVKEQEILDRLATEAAHSGKKGVLNIIAELAPRRLAEALMTRARVPHDRRAAELSRNERLALVEGLKRTAIPISGTLGFKKAEVTAGGVSLDEVDSRTMESKLAPNLFFAGEILDLDGRIGGFNFQSAFSTGFLAGEKA